MEIVQGVHKIPGSFWSALYLIESRDSLALVDSGSPGDGRRIEEYLRSIGRDVKDIEYILVTHSHPDHTGSAFALAEKSGARVAAHRLDSKVHPDGEVSLSYMGVFTSVRLPIPYLRFTEVTDLVSDGDVLPIGDGVRVIHTPGHTPGSLCFMDGGRKLLFSGDTLFSDGDRVSRSVPFPRLRWRGLPPLAQQAGQRGVRYVVRRPRKTACGGSNSRSEVVTQDQPRPAHVGHVLQKHAKATLEGMDSKRRVRVSSGRLYLHAHPHEPRQHSDGSVADGSARRRRQFERLQIPGAVEPALIGMFRRHSHDQLVQAPVRADHDAA